MAAPSSIQTLMPAADAGAGSGRQIEKQPWTLQPADGAGDGGPEEPPHVLDLAGFHPLNPTTSQPADGAGVGGSEEPPHALDVARFRRLNSLIHCENVAVDKLLHLVRQDYHVNLMLDPLLSFVIAYKKPKLINKVSDAMLTATNYDGATALHVAAAMDDKEVALKLIGRVPDLVHMPNVKQEIPLHKAALYGLQDMFWLLVEKNSSPEARREDGATMLHCAIMGNAPGE
ncbi:uncharacterized protein LOC135606059 [Musa acuminata AAA Group]|uniref:uncharacterized protein LOC135605043 n=1 Tax=Musa acuminata AAA Group TaxID=214697 RepID=UPI0031D6CC72